MSNLREAAGREVVATDVDKEDGLPVLTVLDFNSTALCFGLSERKVHERAATTARRGCGDTPRKKQWPRRVSTLRGLFNGMGAERHRRERFRSTRIARMTRHRLAT